MRIHFEEKPYDLLAVIVLSALLVAAAALVLSGPVRIALGMIFILFLPGYALVAVLFPGRKEIDWIERIAFSFGLSIAVVPLLGLALNYTPWGITLESVVSTVFAFTVGMCGAAYFRRMRLPTGERFALSVELRIQEWENYTLLDKVLTIGVVVAILVAVTIVAYAFMVPSTGEKFTEFYILDENGMADQYPTSLNVSENGTVIIGVVNHEYGNVTYTIQKDLVTVQWVYNNTTDRDEPIEISRATIDTEVISISHDVEWEAPFVFGINTSGSYKLEFLLFEGDDFTEPYRSLHLYVEVS